VLVSRGGEHALVTNRVNALENDLIVLSTDDTSVLYWCTADKQEMMQKILHEYFRLEVALSSLYASWSLADPFFAVQSVKVPGVRLLDQPPFEALLAFICSQNNAITRITGMVGALKERFGDRAMEVEGKLVYSFPSPESLSSPQVVSLLRTAGFGYRAPYIQQAALLVAGGKINLSELRRSSYLQAWQTLQTITGVGPKVADCVALTGLGQQAAVPIDTHIWQVARKHYIGMPTGEAMTLKVYLAIGERFRAIFGPTAGWAHLVSLCVLGIANDARVGTFRCAD